MTPPKSPLNNLTKIGAKTRGGPGAFLIFDAPSKLQDLRYKTEQQRRGIHTSVDRSRLDDGKDFATGWEGPFATPLATGYHEQFAEDFRHNCRRSQP